MNNITSQDPLLSTWITCAKGCLSEQEVTAIWDRYPVGNPNTNSDMAHLFMAEVAARIQMCSASESAKLNKRIMWLTFFMAIAVFIQLSEIIWGWLNPIRTF